MPAYRPICPVSELAPGQARRFEHEGREIAVFNTGGVLYAVENTCLHAGGPLHEGTLDGVVVTCPWHEWSFDLTNGRCNMNPKVRLDRYPVRVRKGVIEVKC